MDLTREQLYEQVWTTPANHLSKRLGVRLAALRNACNEHNIPTRLERQLLTALQAAHNELLRLGACDNDEMVGRNPTVRRVERAIRSGETAAAKSKSPRRMPKA